MDGAAAPRHGAPHLRAALHPGQPPRGLGVHRHQPRLRIPLRRGARHRRHSPHRHHRGRHRARPLQGDQRYISGSHRNNVTVCCSTCCRGTSRPSCTSRSTSAPCTPSSRASRPSGWCFSPGSHPSHSGSRTQSSRSQGEQSEYLTALTEVSQSSEKAPARASKFHLYLILCFGAFSGHCETS